MKSFSYLIPSLAALARLFPRAGALVPLPPLPGYELTWSDDFIGLPGSLPNLAEWKIDAGTSYPGGAENWGTDEVEAYTRSPDNVRLDGEGNLAITALRNKHTGNWTSARIETRRSDFMAQPGGKMLIQGRLSLPDVPNMAGYWPAFWALGADYRKNMSWPGSGEFDIMENVNGVDTIYGTFHCGTATGGPCDETNGLGGTFTKWHGSSCFGTFHEYALEFDRSDASSEALRWYIDGQQYWQVLSTNVTEAAWRTAVDHPQFILLNLALGGGMADGIAGETTPTNSTSSGGVFRADYVAVYHAKASSTGLGGGGYPHLHRRRHSGAGLLDAGDPVRELIG